MAAAGKKRRTRKAMNPVEADLRRIPGVGPSLAADLMELGYTGVASLAGQDPEAMYARLMEQVGSHVDRCVLYVFRSAVHYAEAEARSASPLDPKAAEFQWWNWKDGGLMASGR